ncbi:T9SS type A sorting domain-containing protein [Subsaximicrobium wynnwilliamsii]|uniref:T9SS type A sorting domain-containing protein n=1 Tax=Subsaximicrobium wynnwilliamsii TaxID=291179 RepID=A0A5C6ZDP2_9FLAO|nr:T9SS type A sorting domain-containing protein [Subsaximicrobium wynnwilliamsii]TXD81963.1 T9SS type A sorting domain-containing protein [Subsaximicrobium wynnwilliamsii]TXD87661.1 T9SS type A sorting domain-containing protein [Subsaximicrobium wynnwilliamsii]TXE01408.1 T9SS type A sorting domain-containing protein [Subsaximicrobium wynnwilliamsii]
MTFANIENPDPTGINTSARVLQVDKPSGADAGGGFGFEAPSFTGIDLANGTVFTLKIWSTKANLQLRFQMQTGAPTYQRDVIVADAGVWTEVTFNFTGQTGLTGTEQYSVLVIQPDLDPPCGGNPCPPIEVSGTYYIDDITQSEASEPTCNDGIQNGDEEGIDCGGSCPDACDTGDNTVSDFLVDFETPSDFTGGDLTVTEVTNDNPDAVNSSATVLQVENINVAPFANAQFLLSNNSVLDLSTNDRGFALKVRGPRAIPILFKAEDAGNGGINREVPGNYTDVGNWQTVFFDFSAFADPTTLGRIVIFFDITGAPSADGADDLFYIDDVKFGEFTTLSSNQFVASDFKVFPNPTNNAWTIKAKKELTQVQVFDVLGKSVMTLNPNALNVELDASTLNRGIYFAKISTVSGSESVKLIKN